MPDIDPRLPLPSAPFPLFSFSLPFFFFDAIANLQWVWASWYNDFFPTPSWPLVSEKKNNRQAAVRLYPLFSFDVVYRVDSFVPLSLVRTLTTVTP